MKLVEQAYADPASIAPRDVREVATYFFERLAQLEEGTRDHQYVRNTLIEMNLSLVQYAAGRFKYRGVAEREDLVQVGTIGLIKAIDRFELSREVEFTSFAVPWITGEIKRFFRDATWAVHVPRRLKEARAEVTEATEELRQRLGRSPSTAELAERVQLDRAEVAQVQMAVNGYNTASLDAAVSGGSGETDTVLGDFVGFEEQSYELIETQRSLAPLIAELDERDRVILHMRFVEERSQVEIGRELGVSQMHASRLISRLVARLRIGLLGDGGS
ncbi:SigB/SigF/SigG family RNA polymerase sigma factor [Streptomyces sp. cg35]|uniref:SigB/SigF/SigG family RNA polymerase sigma factor n=1 Tax=Streptomyces sp. cg35 TaxID=3421650 RepID=UPI003D186751